MLRLNRPETLLNKQMSCESTAKEVLFEWSHHRISSRLKSWSNRYFSPYPGLRVDGIRIDVLLSLHCHMVYYMYNIIGDELPLNFGSKISVIYNFTREITKLPWQPSVRLSTKMLTKF